MYSTLLLLSLPLYDASFELIIFFSAPFELGFKISCTTHLSYISAMKMKIHLYTTDVWSRNEWYQLKGRSTKDAARNNEFTSLDWTSIYWKEEVVKNYIKSTLSTKKIERYLCAFSIMQRRHKESPYLSLSHSLARDCWRNKTCFPLQEPLQLCASLFRIRRRVFMELLLKTTAFRSLAREKTLLELL